MSSQPTAASADAPAPQPAPATAVAGGPQRPLQLVGDGARLWLHSDNASFEVWGPQGWCCRPVGAFPPTPTEGCVISERWGGFRPPPSRRLFHGWDRPNHGTRNARGGGGQVSANQHKTPLGVVQRSLVATRTPRLRPARPPHGRQWRAWLRWGCGPLLPTPAANVNSRELNTPRIGCSNPVWCLVSTTISWELWVDTYLCI